MKKNITTLAEIEREQEILRMTMKVTRQEFARSLGSNRKQLKSFMIKKVAIPVGAVGLGVSAIKGFSTSDKKAKNNSAGLKMGFLGGLLPLAINLFKVFMMEKQTNKVEQNIPEKKQNLSSKNHLQSVA